MVAKGRGALDTFKVYELEKAKAKGKKEKKKAYRREGKKITDQLSDRR